MLKKPTEAHLGMIRVQRSPEEQMEILMGLMLDLQKQMAMDRRKLFDKMEKRVDGMIESKSAMIEARLLFGQFKKLKEILAKKGILTETELAALRWTKE